MTQGEFRVELERLAKAFGAGLKADMVDAYWETLRDYPATALRVAVSEVIQDEDHNRMPPPVTLLRILRRYSGETVCSNDTLQVRRRLIERKLARLRACVQTERVRVQQDRLWEILRTDYATDREVPF